MLRAKLHRLTVTQADLNYIGSITLDPDLLDAAGLFEGEKVQIVNINNGERFETYTILGERGSGQVGLNGPAARRVQVGDVIIIIAYGLLGLALGNAFPLIISTAGRLSGGKPLRQISLIIAFAYFGLLTGPALLGLVAHMIDLNMTIMTLAGLSLISGLASLCLPRILKAD